jgi:hypothetical protein
MDYRSNPQQKYNGACGRLPIPQWTARRHKKALPRTEATVETIAGVSEARTSRSRPKAEREEGEMSDNGCIFCGQSVQGCRYVATYDGKVHMSCWLPLSYQDRRKKLEEFRKREGMKK